MFLNASPQIFRFAEELRKNMTREEQVLWGELRKSKLGVRFKAQHPLYKFIADFYCHKAKLVIEIDGEIHNFQKDYDIGRTYELEQFGILVIRFSNEQIYNDISTVMKKINQTVRDRINL